MYFKKFNKILYPFRINGKDTPIALMDITNNVRIKQEVLSNITLYDEYIIRDGETPEILAEKFYGRSDYHWIIMLTNNRYDSVADFPQPDRVIEEMVITKYGDNHVNDIHHYEQTINDVIYIVDESEAVDIIPITNRDYEFNLNESKRKIKVISPNIINQLLTQFNAL